MYDVINVFDSLSQMQNIQYNLKMCESLKVKKKHRKANGKKRLKVRHVQYDRLVGEIRMREVAITRSMHQKMSICI